MCCVPAGVGTPWCFDQTFTYDKCCVPQVAGTGGWKPTRNLLSEQKLATLRSELLSKEGLPRALPQVSVDLFVRTYHGKMQELTHLLHSVQLFWPSDWGVLVVLDGESTPDEHACTLLPAWVRCILQHRPSFLRLACPWAAITTKAFCVDPVLS